MTNTKMDTDQGAILKAPTKKPAPEKQPAITNDIKRKKLKDFVEIPDIITLPQPFEYKGKVIKKAYIQEVTGYVEEEYNTPQNKENHGRYMTSLCAACTTQLGDDYKKSEMKPVEWRKLFLDMPMTNRDFIMYCVYILSEGEEIELKETTCPSCRAKGFIAHLHEQTVRYLDQPFVPFTRDLKRGYKHTDGSIYKTVTIDLPNGKAQEETLPLYLTAESKAQSVLFSMCISTINNKNKAIPFNLDVARSLAKTDREEISEAIGENTTGLDILAPIECSCGEKFAGIISVLHFFGV